MMLVVMMLVVMMLVVMMLVVMMLLLLTRHLQDLENLEIQVFPNLEEIVDR
jgi:hypothetical protein